jgi:hypothetical protein
MNKRNFLRPATILFAPLVLLTVIISGCGKNDSPTAAPINVQAGERAAAASNASPGAGGNSGVLAITPPFADGRQTSFQEVVSQLDPGGSLFMYVATDQWLAGLSTNLAHFQQVLGALPGPGEREMVERIFETLIRLVKTSGVEQITGLGVSGAPIAPGLYRNKFIAHHPAGGGQGLLWSLFGQSAHPLDSQAMLPTNTVLAAFTDLNLRQLWQTLEQELAQSGVPQAEETVRNWPRLFESRTQIPWADLLASLDGEIGVVLALDDTQSLEIPMGNRARLTLPAPEALIAVKTKNALLYDRVSSQLRSNPQAVTREEGSLTMCSLQVPGPILLNLTVAKTDSHFFFGTSPEIIQTVQNVKQGQRPGLKSTADFQSLARHLPTEGNQFVYLHQRFGETIADIQRQVMESTGMGADQLAMFQGLFANAKSSFSMSVGRRTPNGWALTSAGNQDSASTILLAPTIGVTAVAAGMLLPALAKAKSRAQTISTVSNLKMLGLAVRMYSNEQGGKFPKADSWCDDIKSFVNNPKVYKAANDPSPARCSFAYNAKLSGLEETKIHPETVLLFEVEDGDWNVSGGPEMLLPRPRDRSYVIGMADGSVMQISPERLRTLRWNP